MISEGSCDTECDTESLLTILVSKLLIIFQIN